MVLIFIRTHSLVIGPTLNLADFDVECPYGRGSHEGEVEGCAVAARVTNVDVN